MAFTIWVTACSKFYVGSSCAILSLCASLASIGNPVRIILFATFSPTILGKIWVPPKPGMIPSVISGSPNCALSEQRMMSQRRASSKPPPRAIPCTTATTGLWCCLNLVSTFLNYIVSGYYVMSPDFTNYLILAPAQKNFSNLLRSTITLIDLSLFSWSRASVMLLRNSLDRALRSLGLLSQIVATSSFFSTYSFLTGWSLIASFMIANLFIESYISNYVI